MTMGVLDKSWTDWSEHAARCLASEMTAKSDAPGLTPSERWCLRHFAEELIQMADLMPWYAGPPRRLSAGSAGATDTSSAGAIPSGAPDAGGTSDDVAGADPGPGDAGHRGGRYLPGVPRAAEVAGAVEEEVKP